MKHKTDTGEEFRFCTDMCRYSFLFQEMAKTSTPDELAKWFHKFTKETFLENIHSECDKKILNLRSMIKAISNNNGVNFNDIEYSRIFSLIFN